MVRPILQDAGKAEALNTFIKARPILVGGNSRGDMEMMLESVGLRVIVNPDDTKPEEAMGGKTVKAFGNGPEYDRRPLQRRAGRRLRLGM